MVAESFLAERGAVARRSGRITRELGMKMAAGVAGLRFFSGLLKMLWGWQCDRRHLRPAHRVHIVTTSAESIDASINLNC